MRSALLPILLIAAIIHGTPSSAMTQEDSSICAGDVPPDGMVIVATGTSPLCGGSCRTRILKPLGGNILVICANQAIPEAYTLESVTTSPACRCLGSEDNAYIIELRSKVPK